jgi:hypothetical protein
VLYLRFDKDGGGGAAIEVWGWAKQGVRGKWKTWTVRREALRFVHFPCGMDYDRNHARATAPKRTKIQSCHVMRANADSAASIQAFMAASQEGSF